MQRGSPAAAPLRASMALNRQQMSIESGAAGHTF